jgi:hypothetical protein
MTTSTAAVLRHERSSWPTRKWLAATITAFAGVLGTLAATGWHFTPAIDGAVITLVGQRIVAYLTPNLDPGRG